MNANPAEFFAAAAAADGLNVTWAHAVNSRANLAAALNSNVMMIESDVICGYSGIPLMAHPPAVDSDLTLQQWITVEIQK